MNKYLYLKMINLSKEQLIERLIEVIEDKKIEKIDNAYYHETQYRINEIFKNKINEIIDYINKEKE